MLTRSRHLNQNNQDDSSTMPPPSDNKEDTLLAEGSQLKDRPETLEQSLEDIHPKLDTITNDHAAPNTTMQEVSANSDIVKLMCSEVKTENVTVRLEVEALKALVVRQSTEIDVLKGTVLGLQTSSMH